MILSGFCILYVTMLSVSIEQAIGAEFAPETFLNNPFASNKGWLTQNITVPDGLYGPLSSNNTAYKNYDKSHVAVRLEVRFTGFTPNLSGATATVALRLVLPDGFMDKNANPSTPFFTTSCGFGNAQITVSVASTGSSSYDMVYSNFQINYGTVLEYPFDKFSAAIPCYCYYITDDAATTKKFPNKYYDPPNNYLNFILAIDGTDTGFFTKTVSYTPSYTTTYNISQEYYEKLSGYGEHAGSRRLSGIETQALDPTSFPSSMPSTGPSSQPSSVPSANPTSQPTSNPSGQPSLKPTGYPSSQPSTTPTSYPSSQPSREPTSQPSALPSSLPSSQPTISPSTSPSSQPSTQPTQQPTSQPTTPTSQPTTTPSVQPSSQPSGLPTSEPTNTPSSIPTSRPSYVFYEDVTVNYPQYAYVFPVNNLVFTRAPINIVFPMFILIAMWTIVISETIVFLPFYLSNKTVDAPGTVMGAVGILFALPNIRNTLPGAPGVGAVIDFAAYFWCLIIAITHFLFASIMWIRFSVILPERTKKAAIIAAAVAAEAEKKENFFK